MIRFFDILLSSLGLIFLSPLFILFSIWIKIDSKGPVLFKQLRVGKDNQDFYLFKFRSMICDAEKKGLQLTVGEKDDRITNSGRFIRKFKLDELPQLFNVLKADMSIVGPRPEVRKYVDMYDDEQKKVLSVRPGITDYASIEYLDESIILGKSENPEETYIDVILPSKIQYNMKYINNQTLVEYFNIIFLTINRIIKSQNKY